MDDLVNLLLPQTSKDIYAKSVGDEGAERSNMMYASQLDRKSGAITRHG